MYFCSQTRSVPSAFWRCCSAHGYWLSRKSARLRARLTSSPRGRDTHNTRTLLIKRRRRSTQQRRAAAATDEDAQQEAAARANPVTIELDFRQVHSNDDVWDEIDRKLGFDDFGRNLDAFVDVLRGGFGHFTVNEFAKLVVRGKQTAAAHCTKWDQIQEILDESVDGECGEQVTAVEWRDDDDE